MISTSLFASVPFRNLTAWNDYTGSLDFFHLVIANTITRVLGVPCLKLPLGAGRLGDPTWLDALTRQHQGECSALSISGPPSFTEYNLNDAAEFSSFTFAVSTDLERIRIAAGVS